VKRLAIVVFAGACTDVPQPFDLDHPRVMAVRIEPPALAGGERATIDVLVTDVAEGPRIADPDTVVVTAPVGGLVERGVRGWEIVAPAVDELVIVPLALEVILDGAPFAAQKTVAFGERAENPAAPSIMHDGARCPCKVDAASEVALTVTEPGEELSYRWFSSVGDLTGYTRAEASLAPLRGTTGTIGVVVRDQAGGTAWTFEPAEVLP